MNNMSSPENRPPASLSSSPSLGPKWIAVLLIVAVVALGYSIWLWRARQPAGREVIVEMVEPGSEAEPAAVYTAEVIDAITRRDIQAEVGRRYKVVIEDESKEGHAGIARIGGLVTFVRDAQVGDIAIVEVTRMKKTSAEARLVRRVETAAPVERKVARERKAPDQPRRSSPVVEGGVYTGVVEDIGRKGEGIVKVQGKVVFVEGAQRGEEIVFRVTEDKDRFAHAERVEPGTSGESTASSAAEAEPATTPTAPTPRIRDGASSRAEDVVEGAMFEVTVTEPDKKEPERNGVARIGGLVIFVPDSRPGERVVIRITERRPRFAFSEVVERKGAANAP